MKFDIVEDHDVPISYVLIIILIDDVFSLLSKNESRLIKSPVCLSVCVSPTNNF
jgi:hypothetical protein